MAKKKSTKRPRPTPAPKPRPGYRMAVPWLLLLAEITGCSGAALLLAAIAGCSGAARPEPPPVEQAKVDLTPAVERVKGDYDGDGYPDDVLEADQDHVVWASGGRITYADRPGSSADFTSIQTPDGEFAEEVDIDGDGRTDTWIEPDPVTSACIPWGGGCASGTCCAPFACMWTGVGINRKKKCCGSTSGSPFYNCQ